MPLYIPTPEFPRFTGNKTITGTLNVGGTISYDGSGNWNIVAPTNGANTIIGTTGNGSVFIIQNNSLRWLVNSNGHFAAQTDNSYDIGASGANRPRDLYLSGVARISGGASGNGQILGIKALTELTTIAAAATTDTAIQLPANALILGVSVRVTTVIPTAATFTVGDSGSAARFNTAAVTVAANSTDPGTKAGAYYNASATSVRITPNLTPGTATGAVRVTIHYFDVTPPTS